MDRTQNTQSIRIGAFSKGDTCGGAQGGPRVSAVPALEVQERLGAAELSH